MNIKYFGILTLLILLLFSCDKKSSTNHQSSKNNIQSLRQDFVGVTRGNMSAYDPLIFLLKEPFTDSLKTDQKRQLITIKPNIEHQIKIEGNKITVTPNHRFIYGADYEVTIALADVLPQRYSNNRTVHISIFKQNIEIERKGLIIGDDDQLFMSLVVYTADKLSEEELKNIFTSDADNIVVTAYDNTKYDVVLSWKNGLQQNSSIKYDANSIGVDKKGDLKLFSMDPNSFDKFYAWHDQSKMTYSLYFSQKIEANQDRTGLITINEKNVEHTVKNNVLTIFLDKFASHKDLLIRVEQDLKSINNKKLNTAIEISITNEVPKPSAEFADYKNMIPSNGDFKIPIKVKQLKSIRVRLVEIKNHNVKHFLAWHNLRDAQLYNLVALGKLVLDEEVELSGINKGGDEWSYYGIDLNDKFKRNPGCIYNISLSFGPQNSNLHCNDGFDKMEFRHSLPTTESFENGESYYRDYYYGGEDYWKNRKNPCHIAYYREHRPISKNVMCNNISMIIKKSGKSYHLAALDVLNLNPLIGASSKWYDYQGDLVAESNLNGEGITEVTPRTRPFVVEIIESNGNKSFLNLQKRDANQLTDFNVSGDNLAKNTRFFIYSDRDIWRPGDSIFVDVMVNKKLSRLPDGIPITARFYNTQRNLVKVQKAKYSSDKHIYSFHLKTQSADKTGVFKVDFEIGPHRISKNLKVETIRPNVAEVIYKFDNFEGGTIFSGDFNGSINAQYLNGFSVKKGNVKAKAKFIAIRKPFKKWKEYLFGNYKLQKPYLANFIETTTNENGTAKIKSKISKSSLKYGVYKMKLETEMILPGGGINKEGKSYTFSPFKEYVGIKNTKGTARRGSFGIGNKINIPIIIVNQKGDITSKGNQVNYTIKKHTKYWWIDKYALHRNYHYAKSRYWEQIEDGNINIKNGKGTFHKNNMKSGAYILEVRHATTGHMASFHFNVYDYNRGVPVNNPEHIDVELSKDIAQPGDQIDLVIPPVKEGKALITIEQYDKVLETFWVDVNDGENIIELTCDENWYPNVYVNVTLLQKYEQINNDRPLRMYGVGSLKVENEDAQLIPDVSYPERTEPDQSFSISVKEKTGQQMQYTIAVVDEGLLNITAFNTPNPYNYFNKKLALLVKTWDVYKYLMNAFKGDYAGIISIGGDDAYQPDLIEDVNRFKPVVKHLGPFTLDAGQTKNHTIDVPNYIGKLRIMVVACNEAKYGTYEGHIWVKSPLMLQSQWPRSLNVTDEFEIPVTIFKDLKTIKSATIKSSFDDQFINGIVTNKIVSLVVEDQITEHLKFSVKNKGGATKIKLDVDGGGKHMEEETDIYVNYPNGYTHKIIKQIIEPGATFNHVSGVLGFEETNSLSFKVSGLNIPSIAEYSKSLIAYPYGCLEQTTSKAFAQLVVDKIVKLTLAENRARNENLESSFLKLQRMQNADGSFRYWPNGYYNTWADLYVGNYLISTQEFDYNLPSNNMLKKWKKFQLKRANKWSASKLSTEYLERKEYFFQAYRLYLLAKSGASPRSAMNRFAQKKVHSPKTLWLMAGAYQLMGYTDRAHQYMELAESAMKSKYWIYYHGFGSNERDLAMIVEILSYFPKDKNKMDFYYNEMVDSANKDRWMSTQSKAYILLATAKYFKGVNINVGQKIKFDLLKDAAKSNHERSSNGIFSDDLNLNFLQSKKEVKIINTGEKPIYITFDQEYIDTELYHPSKNEKLSLKLSYFNLTQSCLLNDCPTKLGDDIAITITVSNLTTIGQDNIALNLKMPSGFELINSRLYETVESNKNMDFEDFRDDRVYSFFSLNSNYSKEFKFKAKAILKGDFLMPAVKVEHMYKGDFYATKKAGRVFIE